MTSYPINTDLGRLVLPDLFTVTQLNQWVKQSLESKFATVRVIGEISNFSRPMSGHIYFTLKDAHGELRCVLFRTYQQADYLPLLKDGISVEITGQITLYSQRGQLQVLVHNLSLQGAGLLKIQFAALKQKLETAGLFCSEHKKPLPRYPKFIGVISSPSAAGLQDFLTIMHKRYPLCQIRVFCAAVQGSHAPTQLRHALDSAQHTGVDVIVFCRGGGALEDLWCFNDEQLAFDIYRCKVPILSAIGHEKDITICDLCADVRAATPTNAAMLVSPDIVDLQGQINMLHLHLLQTPKKILQTKQLHLSHYCAKILHPKEKIQAYQLLLTQYYYRLTTAIGLLLTRAKQTSQDHSLRLTETTITPYVQQLSQALDMHTLALQQVMQKKLHAYQLVVNPLVSQLHSLSPELVLQRGYAVIKKENIIQNTISALRPGDHITLSLSDGCVSAIVSETISEKSNISK